MSSLPPSAPALPLWSRGWFVALVRLAAGIGVLTIVIGTLLNAWGGVPDQTDFLQFRASAMAAGDGGRLYQFFIYIAQLGQIVLAGAAVPDKLSQNLNPPVVTLLFLPLNMVSLRTAYYITCLAQFALALFVFWTFLGRCFGRHALLRPAATLALAFYFPVMANMLLGQLGLLLFCLIALAWLALDQGRDRIAGCWLGLALLLKLFTGLLFVWLALTGRWKTLAWGVGIYLAGMALALLIFGTHNHLDWLRAIAAHGAGAMTWNASLQGVFERYLGAGDVVSHFSLPWLVLALRALAWGLAAFALVWLSCQPGSFTAGFALSLPLMLLLAPLGWIYYFPLLLLSAALLWRETNSTRIKTGLALALLLSGAPQLLGGGDFYTPSFWKAYDKGGYITTVNGQEQTVLYGTYYWFELPELYTIALLAFALVALACYRSRSTQTGA